MRICDLKYFYINCKKDTKKNNNMKEQWNITNTNFETNIPLIRRDAVHYNDYSYPYYNESFHSEESKIVNQISNIAVFKSHTNLWKYIWDNKIKYALIFEDDVIIPNTFLNDLQNILNKNNDFISENNWDILYFGILRMMAKKTNNNDFHRILNKKGYNNGLHCYLVNLNTVGKLINIISKQGINTQIDILIRDNADNLKLFVYKDLIIKQDVENFESTRLGRFVKNELKINFDELNLIS